MSASSRAVTRGFSVRGFTGTVTTGLQLAGGWMALSALGALEARLGVGDLLGRLPGIARTVAGYVVKGINVALVGVAAGFVLGGRSSELRANLVRGAMANFGVTLGRDVLGMVGGPGARLSAFLSGFGDYFGSDGWPVMGDYLTAGGAPYMGAGFGDQSILPPRGGGPDGIYSGGDEMYPLAAGSFTGF